MKKEIWRNSFKLSANYFLSEFFVTTLAIPAASRSDALPLPDRPKPWPKVDCNMVLSFIWDDENVRKPIWYATIAPQGWDLLVTHVHSWPKFLTEQAAESGLTKVAAVLIGGTLAPVIGGALAALVPSETSVTQTVTGISSNGYPTTIVLTGFNL